MNATQDFLDHLNKLTFVKYEDKTFYTAEGYEIRYELQLMGLWMPDSPIQFQFRIIKDNIHIKTFGCVSNESVLSAVKWWENKEFNIHVSKSDKEAKKRHELIKEFENLT